MLVLILLALAVVVVAHLAWPTLTGRPQQRSVVTRLLALLRLDETLERVDRTLVHTDASLTHVSEAVGELARVMDRLERSLHHLDTTMEHVRQAAESVDRVAQRALPLLATLEKVATPMTAATRAARLVRRSGGSPEPKRSAPADHEQVLPDDVVAGGGLDEVLDPVSSGAYGSADSAPADFGHDDTLVIRPVS